MQFLYTLWLNVAAHPIFFTEMIVVVLLLACLLLKEGWSTSSPSANTVQQSKSLTKSPLVITSKDIKAIAGDNVMMTQIDLARAYIEIGKATLAKKILDHVIQHGNTEQQQAAQHLIANL